MASNLLRLITKNIHLPAQTMKIVETQATRFLASGLTQTQKTSIADYFTSLDIHDDYLKFFGVAQVKDEKEKIKSVGRYVGLELPQIFGGEGERKQEGGKKQ